MHRRSEHLAVPFLVDSYISIDCYHQLTPHGHWSHEFCSSFWSSVTPFLLNVYERGACHCNCPGENASGEVDSVKMDRLQFYTGFIPYEIIMLNQIRDFATFEPRRIAALRRRIHWAHENAEKWQRQEFNKFLLAMMSPTLGNVEYRRTIGGIFYDQGLFYLSKDYYQFINGLARKAIMPLFANVLKGTLKPIYSSTVSLSLVLMLLCSLIEAEKKGFSQWCVRYY